MLQGEHSAILLTFIKLPFVIKIFILSIFEWPFYTSLLYTALYHSQVQGHVIKIVNLKSFLADLIDNLFNTDIVCLHYTLHPSQHFSVMSGRFPVFLG